MPAPHDRPRACRAKSLLGLPWRYALACMDELGLILRRDIIWCLSGGARVYARTPTGDRPLMLRDLVRSYRPENVQLWNGERWTQVLGWNRSPDRDGALELELRTGERIGCTPGHRWPTQRGVIRADEIRIGDVIATTRLPEPDDPATPRALPLEDIGWLVGLYMAEGSRSEKTLQFAGHVREDARHERLARIAEMYHGTRGGLPDQRERRHLQPQRRRPARHHRPLHRPRDGTDQAAPQGRMAARRRVPALAGRGLPVRRRPL